MRLIDADTLFDAINALERDYGRVFLSAVIDEIKYAPTISIGVDLAKQPNESLTLEQVKQLKEGDVVWLYDMAPAEGYYGVIKSIDSSGLTLFSHIDGDFASFKLYGKTYQIYARKPEGVE